MIIETNMSEVGELQKRLKIYRPINIELPKIEDMEIAKSYPTKPSFWYKTGENEPVKYGFYNSPKDTIGKNVTSFNQPREFKFPKSGLSATVNVLDKHYCIEVRQFINYKESLEYINQLRLQGIIRKESIAFPVPENEYQNLKYNFDIYTGIK